MNKNKMKIRIQLLAAVTFLFWVAGGKAQSWSISNPASIEVRGSKDIVPQKFVVYKTDFAAIKETLWTAPEEADQLISSSATRITIGLADGSADIFRIVRYEMMEPGLSAKYPDIRTFRGQSVSNPQRTIRADWTKDGFRAVIRDENGMIYIDPYQRHDLANRIVYYSKDFIRTDEWTCGVTDTLGGFHGQANQRLAGDCMFRSYRLAQATTGEYSNYFGATSSAQSGLVLSQVVTAVNRVNEVYEADIAVRLILIANTSAVFYYDPATDPYSADACTQLAQNQTTITNVIGSANYDIGHVFGVGSGGCAGLGVICNSSQKARGATGLNPPTGDPFYIDYVAHEMGHEFGGNHTFNGTAGSCGGGNRVASAAYEVGSGTTIMAYAGICGAQDVQPHSDPYFHAKSIAEISAVLTGTNCATFITLNNTPPTVTPVADYTIPISTPFVLTGVATDPNNDPLTYCWEEFDLETTSTEPPTSDDLDGPLFRSLNPSSSPSRYIPRLSDLTTNTNYAWEVLPSVSRTMNFRLTVRDYHNIAGCTTEDNIVVSANANAGPFTVTSQNTATTWLEGSSQTITWNVANTTASPVSCANVDIRYSTDGGLTYPTALLMNTTNDGSATITVPNGTTTHGRVMVKGSNNIFFDINNTDIVVNPGTPNFTIDLNPTSVSECNDGSVQTTVIVGSFMGFTNPVTLSLINPPPGAIVLFNPTIVIPGSNSTLTISNLQSLFGTYTPTVRGTSTTGNKDATFTINLFVPLSGNPTLLLPVNNEMNADPSPLLDWSSMSGASSYEYQIANDINFTSIAQTGTVNTDQYQVTIPLLINTFYYWRVRGQNLCGNGNWSSIFTFKTLNCVSMMSTDVPKVISATGHPTITSILNVPNSLTITDLNVIGLMGTHTYVHDLRFSLLAPNSTTVIIWDRPCLSEDNFNINFDDEAANGNWPCPPTDGLFYIPSNPLTPFDGLNSSGIWTLKVEDLASQDGGSLNAWGLKVCGTTPCQLLVNQTSGTGAGSLPAALACAVSGDTVKLSASLAGQTIDIGNTPLQINANITILALAANISLSTTGIRMFDIPNGTTTQLNGMIIKAGTSLTGGAINNLGILTLKDAIVKKNPAVNGAILVQNNAGSQLLLQGNSFINQQ